MKTTLQFLGLNIHNSWYRLLDQHLDYWQRLATVTAAEVIMERQPQGKSGCQVQVRLELPDDILQAETTAKTLKAALHLVSRALEGQILVRKARRIARRASRPRTEPASDGGLIAQPPVPDGGKSAVPAAFPALPHPQVSLT